MKRLKKKEARKNIISKTSVISLENMNREKSGVNYKLSAAYVNDAIEGRFYKAGLGKNMEQGRYVSVWCLHVTSHFTYTMLLFMISSFHCIMSAFEHPQMIGIKRESLNRIAFWGGIACCVFYFLDLMIMLVYCGFKQYFAFIHGRLYTIFVLLISSDYILFMAFGRMIFRLLRPMLLIFRVPALRRTGLVMLGVTPKFLQFLLIIGGCVTIFAVIGVHFFMTTYIKGEVVQRQHDGIYVGAFNHTGIAILEIFVLMAGGSYPRFMIPAYDRYGPTVLSFFIPILLIGEIILYGILVAKIYDFYMDANKHHVKEERYHERQCLIKAFEILDINSSGSISFTEWKGLLQALRPRATSSEILKRFRKLKDLSRKELSSSELNDDINNLQLTMNLVEFFCLPNVLQFTVEKPIVARSFENSSSEWNGLFRYLQKFGQKTAILCRRWYYNRFAYYVSLTLNVLFLAPFTLMWNGISTAISNLTFFLESILLMIISLEVIAQFIALGYKFMLREMLLHVITVVIAVGCITYSRIVHYEKWNIGWPPVIAYLCMVIRLVGFKRKSSSTFHWLRRIAPPFLTLLSLAVIAFYTYGVLGMECFGYSYYVSKSPGVMPEGVSLCKYGFETLGCSLLTLYQISLGSSWHKVMHFIMDEVSSWSSVYFVFFYAFMQMLVLNVISAIMVELSNAIYVDETEAKQRDKEDETKAPMPSPRQRRKSENVFVKRNSSNNASLIAAGSTFSGCVTTQDGTLPFPSKPGETTTKQLLPPLNEEVERFRRVSEYSRQVTLPCMVEDEMVIEDMDEVTLTGRKELGKWTRDILPDMTFLNAGEMKRLYEDMGKSVEQMRINQARKRRSTTTSRVIEVT